MTLAELLDQDAPRPIPCTRCAERGEPATAVPGLTYCSPCGLFVVAVEISRQGVGR